MKIKRKYYEAMAETIENLLAQNERLQAINDALNQDLDYANETIVMYEEAQESGPAGL